MTGTQKRAIRYYQGMSGLGDMTAQQLTSSIGAGLMAAAPLTGPAAPFVAAAGTLTALIGGLFKPDLTKIQASNIVNQIESQILVPLRSQWLALPANQKTESMRAQYLVIYDHAWQSVMQGCSNPALGPAGQACISDRQLGACHYTIDGQTPGIPPTNCGNWFVWYRDVAAKDPEVIPDPVTSVFGGGPGTVGGSIDTAVSEISNAFSGISPLVVVLGAIGVGLILVSD